MTRVPFALLAGMAAFSIAAAMINTNAHAGQPDALARVAPGAYRLSESGGGERTQCIADPGRVLQVAHADAGCARSVLDRSPSEVTVRYTCPGSGVGQSQLTAYTAGKFRLHTQGIARGAPFDRHYDARRIGDCNAAR